jgi:S-formylglutathione hydrolase FrmB
MEEWRSRIGFAENRARVPCAFLVAAALLFGLSGAAAASGADQAQVIEEQQVAPRVVELTIGTSAFAAPTKVQVILPTGYDTEPTRQWPVTYFTAGTSNRYNSFNDALDGTNLTAGFPSIIVSPDANSGYWSDWYNGGAFGPPMYETFVIDQLIPLIDARFRTVADRSHRAIFGISMGGYGAMMLAARHPDLFAAAASLSGAVDSNLPANGSVLSLSSTFDGAPVDAIYGPRITQEVRWRGHNPVDLADNLDGLDLTVLTANGTLNPEIGEGDDPNDALSCAVEKGVHQAGVNLHERLTKLGIDHEWKDYGAGCHSLQNFTREVTYAVGALAETFSNPPARPKEIDYRSIEPDFDVWGWSVKADPARALEFLRLRGSRTGVRLDGSGRTRITTPAWFRGLKRVDVNGRPFSPKADGRLRFTVELGPAHTAQQFTPGAARNMRSRRVSFEPHAVIRIVQARYRTGRLRVCARSIGGGVPVARIRARGAAARMRIGTRVGCSSIRVTGKPARITITGRDRFGHPVRASAVLGFRT